MAALSTNTVRSLRTSIRQSFKIANGVTLYQGSYVALNSSGYLTTYAGTAAATSQAAVIVGYVLPSPYAPDIDVSLVGNTALTPVPEATVETAEHTLQAVSVTGVTAISDVGSLVYLNSNDNDLTLTRPSGAVALGCIDRYITSTTCDVRVFSYGVRKAMAEAAKGSDLLYANTADSASVTNTTTETAFDKSVTLVGAELLAGDVIHVVARAFCVSTNSTDTLTLKLYAGTEEIATTGAVDVANSDIGFIESWIVVRTAGASGAVSATNLVALGVPGTVTAKPSRKDQASEDLSGNVAITVKATWSVASASNDVILEDLIVTKHRAI